MQTKQKPSNSASSAWVRFRSAAYLRGRGISYGIAGELFPRAAIATGKYSLVVFPTPQQNVDVCDTDLDALADDAWDHVVVGPQLERTDDPGAVFRKLAWKLRLGGHAVIYLPHESEQEGIRFKFDLNSVEALLRKTGAWKLKGSYVRNGKMLVIAKKIVGHRGTVVEPGPRPEKRACIVRYGALGDMVMITPLIRRLAEDGYHVTMNVTPYALPVLENNPHVGNIVVQEREIIPNSDLGPYWDEWSGEYDRYINLSESIEGSLLKVEGRRDFFTTQAWRHGSCNVNYYDHTMALGGYSEATGQRGELFFMSTEEREARKFRKEHDGKFLVVWALNGSSHHKIYPLIENVIDRWLESHPDTTFVLTGDANARRPDLDQPQVIHAEADWPLRRVLALLPVADCVIGPESAVANAAACFDTPKITFLSHSTHENLCKYWVNDYCLAPEDTACYPCHQLHYTMESCPVVVAHDPDTGEELSTGPACVMGAISPERVLARLEEVYQRDTEQVKYNRSILVNGV